MTLTRRPWNGIYEAVDFTSTSGKHLYKRTADFNESTDVMPGVKIPVLESATYASTIWKLINQAPYIMNTTEFEFALDTGADARQVLQREYTFDGDNAKTNFVCTHNCNTRFVHIQAVDENYKAIGVDWAATSVNDVTVYLNAPLATRSKLTIILQAMVEP